MYNIVYAGGGGIPKALDTRYTTAGMAEKMLDNYRRSTFPEMYA